MRMRWAEVVGVTRAERAKRNEWVTHGAARLSENSARKSRRKRSEGESETKRKTAQNARTPTSNKLPDECVCVGAFAMQRAPRALHCSWLEPNFLENETDRARENTQQCRVSKLCENCSRGCYQLYLYAYIIYVSSPRLLRPKLGELIPLRY